jgi:TP53 regulating kinase-like protein
MNSSIIKKELIKKGAEANLYYGKWFNKKVIFKHRIPKEYRLKELDERIRSFRTINEAKALIKVKEYGINVPKVYEINSERALIIMDFIPGKKLKDLVPKLNNSKLIKYFKQIGVFIAQLHINGEIHGDITTSNVIITDHEEVFLIDFGLHEFSETIEDKSVDLHLFKRVLMSSHGNNYKPCFNSFLQGYRLIYEKKSKKECNAIIKNIEVIESRGRYVKKSDRL